MRSIVGLTLLLTAMPALGQAPATPAGKVDLKVVDFRELGSAIRDLRGQVVVVDVWANF